MKVIVFYSFKGGVGRTALMLHLGMHWADRGKVVALVDMDLQAPGLSFHPWLKKPDANNEFHKVGVSDLLTTFYMTKDHEKRTFTFFSPTKSLREIRPEGNEKKRWGSNGRLMVLPAGDVTIPQSQVIQGADAFPIPAKTPPGEQAPLEQRAMWAFSQKFIEDFSNYKLSNHPRKAGIDYLLIDCRTGYPELAELTLGYMADRLVLVSGLNQQNLKGLDITLKKLRLGEKLRPARVEKGMYASEILVAFSPVPAHSFEDPDARKALEDGELVLKNNRQPS
ncbi:MAG: AAA family ATPase, partial [Magnetococcales bacterium]|nr:AAA family ATPase [Magnetococcales bacterium]